MVECYLFLAFCCLFLSSVPNGSSFIKSLSILLGSSFYLSSVAYSTTLGYKIFMIFLTYAMAVLILLLYFTSREGSFGIRLSVALFLIFLTAGILSGFIYVDTNMDLCMSSFILSYEKQILILTILTILFSYLQFLYVFIKQKRKPLRH